MLRADQQPQPGRAGRGRLTRQAASDLLTAAERRGKKIQLISRSDSTLRGHLLAEVAAVQAARQDVLGRGFDGVLLIPAFPEAGRVTAGGIHFARIGPGFVPVGETEFARDPAFGYRSSELREFIAERSGGAVRPEQVARHQPGRHPARRRRTASPGGWPRCPAAAGWWWTAPSTPTWTSVASGVLQAEQAGQAFLFRTGPSFVRALAGQDPQPPLRGARIWPPGHGAGPAGTA